MIYRVTLDGEDAGWVDNAEVGWYRRGGQGDGLYYGSARYPGDGYSDPKCNPETRTHGIWQPILQRV